jgi:PadR family transcriptional regulator, regulatory protein PadR
LQSAHFFRILEEMRQRDFLGEFELMVLLAVMRLGEQAYGVPICGEIEKRARRAVAVSSVYAALERLQEKAFVTSFYGEPTEQRGGRAKRFFQITSKGLTAARQTQLALTNLWAGLPGLERGTA